MWYFSKHSSIFFVYCDISIDLLFLSCILTGVTMSGFVMLALVLVGREWISQSDSCLFCPSRVLCMEGIQGFTSCSGCCTCRRILQNFTGLSFHLFVSHTSFKKKTKQQHPLTGPNPEEPASLFLRNKGPLNSEKPQITDVQRKGGDAIFCSITCVDCVVRTGTNSKWKLRTSWSLSRTSVYLSRCFGREKEYSDRTWFC